jgi:HK97 family phage major capsid protein
MTNIITLRQRAHDLRKQMERMNDKAASEHRDFSVAESAEFEHMIASARSLDDQIHAAEIELDKQRGGTGIAVDAGAGRGVDLRPAISDSDSKLARQSTGPRYAQMFPGALSSSGFADLNEFLRTVHSGLNDSRLQAAATGHSGAVPTDGGFFIPTEFAAEMLDVALESEIVRPRAKIYPMKSQIRKIAGFDDLDNSGGAPYGGLSIQWSNEADAGTNKKTKTRLIELNAQKAMIFTYASNELIADGMSFDELLGGALVKSIGWGLDYAFLNGDGAGKPMGVLKDPALIVVNKEGGQAAATLLYANVVKMFARLHPSCVPNSVWVANSTTIPALLQMQLVVQNVAGTENVGGSAVPVVTQQNGQMYLLTRPIIFTEKTPAIGSQGDILLVDFSQYAIGLRKEVSVERSIFPGWTTDESAYRCIMRVDGQGSWNKPFTPKNGSTLSWCVTLQAR